MRCLGMGMPFSLGAYGARHRGRSHGDVPERGRSKPLKDTHQTQYGPLTSRNTTLQEHERYSLAVS
jgi:hypothetical protein